MYKIHGENFDARYICFWGLLYAANLLPRMTSYFQRSLLFGRWRHARLYLTIPFTKYCTRVHILFWVKYSEIYQILCVVVVFSTPCLNHKLHVSVVLSCKLFPRRSWVHFWTAKELTSTICWAFRIIFFVHWKQPTCAQNYLFKNIHEVSWPVSIIIIIYWLVVDFRHMILTCCVAIWKKLRSCRVSCWNGWPTSTGKFLCYYL